MFTLSYFRLVLCILMVTSNNVYFVIFQTCALSSGDDSEVSKAKAAEKYVGKPTIFSKIIDKSIPADIIYEDDKVEFIFSFI